MNEQINQAKFTHLYQQTLNVLWAAALISLPFTSFPLLVNLTGAVVAPLAAIPIGLLIILWFIPYVLKRGSLPRETTPLLIFILFVLLSCTLAFFLEIPGFKGRSITDQELRALVTLIIGFAFFLVFSTWPQDETRLITTYRWLNISGLIILIWTFIEAYYIFIQDYQYPNWMLTIQEWLVVQTPNFMFRGRRVMGFTYEASWFAHQMIILYIPLWLAATYQRTSAFQFRLLRLSVENILLGLGLALFFLASPRIGLISFLLIIVFIFIKLNLSLLRRLVAFISHSRLFKFLPTQAPLQVSATILITLLLLVGYVILLIGVIFFASRYDYRMELLVTDPPTWLEIKGFLTLDESVLLSLAHRLVFLERMVYWFTGWHIFNDYPWFGVGLGNAGFFALKQTPAIGWASHEVRSILLYWPQLPNTKNLWVRLLAETGLVGFSAFFAWLVTLFNSARLTLQSKKSILVIFAFMGQLSLIALLGEGFSIDSFAMPYYWVAAGLIASAGCVYRKQLRGLSQLP